MDSTALLHSFELKQIAYNFKDLEKCSILNEHNYTHWWKTNLFHQINLSHNLTECLIQNLIELIGFYGGKKLSTAECKVFTFFCSVIYLPILQIEVNNTYIKSRFVIGWKYHESTCSLKPSLRVA